MIKVNRNDPCPCGSGKKYKKCCGLNAETKKPRLGGAKLFSQGAAAQNPTLNLAQRVFKVLTAPSGAAKALSKGVEEELSKEPPKGYGTLEELIGIEGAPAVPPPAS
jgi:hypothetical protein